MNNEVKFLSPFKRMCITIGNLPTAYIESMSYYEGLTFLVNYLANNVIPAVNTNSEAVKELQEKYIELKNYVDNYFENLDVNVVIYGSDWDDTRLTAVFVYNDCLYQLIANNYTVEELCLVIESLDK